MPKQGHFDALAMLPRHSFEQSDRVVAYYGEREAVIKDRISAVTPDWTKGLIPDYVIGAILSRRGPMLVDIWRWVPPTTSASRVQPKQSSERPRYSVVEVPPDSDEGRQVTRLGIMAGHDPIFTIDPEGDPNEWMEDLCKFLEQETDRRIGDRLRTLAHAMRKVDPELCDEIIKSWNFHKLYKEAVPNQEPFGCEVTFHERKVFGGPVHCAKCGKPFNPAEVQDVWKPGTISYPATLQYKLPCCGAVVDKVMVTLGPEVKP